MEKLCLYFFTYVPSGGIFFGKLSAISTKRAHKLFCRIWSFRNFRRQFRKNCGANWVILPKKSETKWKSTHKPWHNSCSKRTHSADSERDKNKLETKTSSCPRRQCIPAGYSVSLLIAELITISIVTIRSISREVCILLLTFCKISTAILRILCRHLQTELRSALQSTSIVL